ncbi:MAG TPA: fibronectin type III domain-containing protein [Luteolibacter sp.]|nr:fibronectin type III domain-containing protein [Luteolibacter sp.]
MAGVLMALLFQATGEVRGQTPQGSYEVKLAWNASVSTDVTGYRIHYGTASRAYTASVVLGNVTSATISGLAEGVTYYFALSAFNAEGLESDLTHEVIFKPGLHSSQIGIAANGESVMTVQGLIGRQYDIEASEDLKTWTLIDTITIPEGGSVRFTDPDAPLHARRFYRTRATP